MFECMVVLISLRVVSLAGVFTSWRSVANVVLLALVLRISSRLVT